MKAYARFFPWAVVSVALLYVVASMVTPEAPAGKMNYDQAGLIPVVEGGRIKPFDTYARNLLMAISKRQTFMIEIDKKTTVQPATRWVLDVMTSRLTKDSPTLNYKVFRIENLEVLKLLGLEPRSGFRYALSEFTSKMEQIETEAKRADAVEPAKRDLFDVKLLELARHIETYIKLSSFQTPLLLPAPEAGKEHWEPLGPALAAAMQQEGRFEDPRARKLGDVLLAYAEKKPAAFNRDVKAYLAEVGADVPESTSRLPFEAFFNHFEPFWVCTILYVIVFLLACFGWLFWSEPLNRAAFLLCALTLLVHTWALFARMYLMDRPLVFVTNLYSSAVFIGWGCVALGLVIERIYRNGIGNVVAATLGFITMLLAHFFASTGDTLEMMQAVLDTNFWLATHVTCVTFGYTATLVAGLLGVLFVLLGVFTRALDKSAVKTFGQMIYGVVCFATLLSFLGTVLGGIWADQSWGRFWGWDPKENGALLIVIWNALILHARWAGLVKERGMAVLTVAGNMITVWSWFGTNQLGVGLHAYGFNNTLAKVCTIVWGLHLVVIALGCLPRAIRVSFQNRMPDPLFPPPMDGRKRPTLSSSS